jgi:hypothetical protein
MKKEQIVPGAILKMRDSSTYFVKSVKRFADNSFIVSGWRINENLECFELNNLYWCVDDKDDA